MSKRVLFKGRLIVFLPYHNFLVQKGRSIFVNRDSQILIHRLKVARFH